MDRQSSPKPNYEEQIEQLISSVMRMSKLAQNLSTPKEQEQMENKKAVFVIKGISKRYVFEINEGQLKETEDLNNVTTYCYCASPELFLETIDKILAGDASAFQRALQRGTLVMKGRQSFHDQIMWKKGLERIAILRRTYGAIA